MRGVDKNKQNDQGCMGRRGETTNLKGCSWEATTKGGAMGMPHHKGYQPFGKQRGGLSTSKWSTKFEKRKLRIQSHAQ